jgi:FlaA1/EpsC-like NDP-sugar epimerase
VRIEFTGLRPGEKLNEELLINGEQGVRSTKFSKIFVVEPVQRDWSAVDRGVEELEGAAHMGDASAIRSALLEMNIGYQNGGVDTSHAIDESEPAGSPPDQRDRFARLAAAV